MKSIIYERVNRFVWNDMDFDLKLEHPDDVSGDGPWLKKFVFDLEKKEMSIEQLSESRVEFPLVNPEYQGKEY